VQDSPGHKVSAPVAGKRYRIVPHIFPIDFFLRLADNRKANKKRIWKAFLPE
jgi:hypothetical protein